MSALRTAKTELKVPISSGDRTHYWPKIAASSVTEMHTVTVNATYFATHKHNVFHHRRLETLFIDFVDGYDTTT